MRNEFDAERNFLLERSRVGGYLPNIEVRVRYSSPLLFVSGPWSAASDSLRRIQCGRQTGRPESCPVPSRLAAHIGMAAMDMRLTLIRHAQSVSNAGGLTQPHDTIPLTAHGHLQARALAARLAGPAPAVRVSRFVRAQQTAAPYCQRFNLDPQVDADLDEFSVIDPALIAGLNGAQRKPHVQAYWAEPDLHRRLGESADTFAEFVERVRRFQARLDHLADGTVIFGHGIWLAMLQWHLQGQGVTDTAGMREFREYQLQLPMPNCAVMSLVRGREQWSVESERAHG